MMQYYVWNPGQLFNLGYDVCSICHLEQANIDVINSDLLQNR